MSYELAYAPCSHATTSMVCADKQNSFASAQLMSEAEFYEGYRQRLEKKLNQKITQITRDERLLESLSEAEKPAFKKSLHQAIDEREEIQKLLTQVRERLETVTKPKVE